MTKDEVRLTKSEGEENSAFLRPSKIMHVNIPLRAIAPFPSADAFPARGLPLSMKNGYFFRLSSAPLWAGLRSWAKGKPAPDLIRGHDGGGM
jgi:hypothetical protein